MKKLIMSLMVMMFATTFMVSTSQAGSRKPAQATRTTASVPTREPQSEDEADGYWDKIRHSFRNLIHVDKNGLDNIRDSYIPKADSINSLATESLSNQQLAQINKAKIQAILQNSHDSLAQAMEEMSTGERIIAKPLTYMINYEIESARKALVENNFAKIGKRARFAKSLLVFVRNTGTVINKTF